MREQSVAHTGNDAPSSTGCSGGNHLVGVIRNRMIRLEEWPAAIAGFRDMVHDFNTRGMRQEVPHPGWAQRWNFCADCGASVSGLQLAGIYDEVGSK